ncbi:hypothetical protein B7Z17_02600 [Candidatus Saccharibacteria bacterium 32-49-10]|nr:MAG: hypothetical protein B7Z17_02600 [Candidatus Saccharibacteria bacterium 32-49-10]
MADMMHPQSIEILKALADDVRLSVVRYLAKQPGVIPSCDVVQSCASLMELSQPTMSHHLKKLVEAGVLVLEKRKTENFYTVNRSLCREVGIDIDKL